MKILILLFSLMVSMAQAATYEVPSQQGALQALFSQGGIVSGDIILLGDGNHGTLELRTAAFADRVTIKSKNKLKAHFDSIYVRAPSANLAFLSISVWPTEPYKHSGDHVATEFGTSKIIFNGLDIRGGADGTNFMAWSADEWLKRSANGIWLSGDKSAVLNTKITGVNFGAYVLGADSRAVGNVINGFHGDGIRGQGNRSSFKDNIITNCFTVNDNHSDGFQAHTDPAHPISGLIIERNVIIEWNLGPNPLRCGLQGIGMFDGWYDKLTIRNNIIVVSHGHGIGVMGVRGGIISFNTAVSANGLRGDYPWIAVFPLKDGTKSSNVVVANNLAMSISNKVVDGVTYVGNSQIIEPQFSFLDLKTYVPTLMDSADPAYTVPVDNYGHARPFGSGNDVGAVEAGSTLPKRPTTFR